jgi:hypothetical protein
MMMRECSALQYREVMRVNAPGVKLMAELVLDYNETFLERFYVFGI